MKKLMLVAVATAVGVLSAADSGVATNAVAQAAVEAEPVELEEKSADIFEVGFDFDFFSAYVWRNAISTDEMVMQPCVWGDLTYFEPFWLGFSIWQNYDLTDRRCNQFKYGLNETDYNVHLGATAWESDDEAYSVDMEIGHDWYVYHGVRDGVDYPDLRELYAKIDFSNPFVGVYGKTAWMYEDFDGIGPAMHYEIGFNKEVEIVESLTLGADWNVNFGDPRYLSFLYGGVSNPYYAQNEDGAFERYDDYDAGSKGGIGGTTVKIYLTWQITDWMSLGGVIAYTGVLNGALRESIGDQGGDYEFCGNPGEGYARDLCWGGLQLKISY